MSSARSKRWDLPRYPVCVTAKILFNGHEQSCIIEERSPLGARIRVNLDLALPNRFTIEITPSEFIAARVAWRRDDLVGVSLELPGNAPGLLERVGSWFRPHQGRGGLSITRQGSS